MSVVFGNISLFFLPVSFNQAIGAWTTFFTAVFAFRMRLKREAWLTYFSLVPVVTGVVIANWVLQIPFVYFYFWMHIEDDKTKKGNARSLLEKRCDGSSPLGRLSKLGLAPVLWIMILLLLLVYTNSVVLASNLPKLTTGLVRLHGWDSFLQLQDYFCFTAVADVHWVVSGYTKLETLIISSLQP